MTLHSSLLALVLLLLGGGLEPTWTVEVAEDSTECPVAPEAPADVELESGEEEGVVGMSVAIVGVSRVGAFGMFDHAASTDRRVGTPPPRA